MVTADITVFTHDMADTGSDSCCLHQQLQMSLLVMSFSASAGCEVILIFIFFLFVPSEAAACML